jgi:hypothetical protein
MKKISLKILGLLLLSLFASIFATPILLGIFSEMGNSHGGLLLMVFSVWLTLIPFVLSLTAFLNLNSNFRKNHFLCFFSFVAFPFIFSVIFIFLCHFDLAIMVSILPYNLCMIISYINFRRFCKNDSERVTNYNEIH